MLKEESLVEERLRIQNRCRQKSRADGMEKRLEPSSWGRREDGQDRHSWRLLNIEDILL